MDRRLQLKVILSAVDKLTAPFKSATAGGAALAEQLKRSRAQLKALEGQEKTIGSFRALSSGVRRTSEAMQAQQQRVQQLSTALKQTENPTRAMRVEFERAQAEASKLKDRHAQQTATLQRLRSQLNSSGAATTALGAHSRKLRQDKTQLTQAIEEQTRKLKALADVEARRAALHARGDKLASTGASLAAGGAAYAYGAQRVGTAAFGVLQPGIEFGAQLSELQAISRLNKDDPMFQQLKEQADKLGAETAFSAKEAAAGQTFLARAGYSPQAILSSMEDVLNLALANKTDVARAADIASNIGGAFKIDPEIEGNFTRLADVLTGTAARANVNLEMLGESMKYLAGAEDLNITLEQAAALTGMLGNVGIQGSMAGTTVREMVNRLTNPAGEAIKIMQQLGLEVADAEGNMRGLPDILQDIGHATKRMGNAERKSILQTIFGSRAGTGTAELVSKMADGGLLDLIEQLKDLGGENAATAKNMADNVAGDLQNLSSAWDSVGIALHDMNEGPLREFIGSLTEVIRGATSWMREHPRLTGALLKWGGILLGITAVLGVLAAAVGTVMIGVGGFLKMIAWALPGFLKLKAVMLALSAAWAWMGTTAIPMVLGALKALSAFLVANPIVVAIALLAGAAYLLWQNWDRVRAGAAALWADIKALFGEGWAWFMGLVDAFSNLGSALVTGLIGGITSKFGALKDTVIGMGSSITGWFKEKLGIRSPSRVFAEFGVRSLQGYSEGLGSAEQQPLKQLAAFGQRLRQAGSGLLLGAAAGSAFADVPDRLSIDTRPPLAASASAGGIHVGSISVQVVPSPGMNEQALARYVAQEVQRALDAAAHRGAAQRRSAFQDID